MNEFISSGAAIPSSALIAIALIIHCLTSSKKPICAETNTNQNEVTKWRHRLGLTVESASELLGVPTETILGLESGKYDITRRTKLAMLACELAYIGADQYIKAHPNPSHNYSHKNHVEYLGRQAIRKRFLDEGFNNQKEPLIITIPPKSLIHYAK